MQKQERRASALLWFGKSVFKSDITVACETFAVTVARAFTIVRSNNHRGLAPNAVVSVCLMGETESRLQVRFRTPRQTEARRS